MKPTSPHDPFDDLIAAALHGELTPEERVAFELRLKNDSSAHAAYLETQLMHDLLEKTNREAQPDPAFEQRMISGVRRKIQHGETPRESAWESVLVLWRVISAALGNRWMLGGGVAAVLVLIVTLALPGRNPVRRVFAMNEMEIGGRTVGDQKEWASSADSLKRRELLDRQSKNTPEESNSIASLTKSAEKKDSPDRDFSAFATVKALAAQGNGPDNSSAGRAKEEPSVTPGLVETAPVNAPSAPPPPGQTQMAMAQIQPRNSLPAAIVPSGTASMASLTLTTQQAMPIATDKVQEPASSAGVPASDASRKLIRNAQLDLEVKNYQDAVDQVGVLTKAAGGYVDTSNSQRGGNGKLQGTVVVKILPENLDGFLLKSRGLGDVKTQSVSTDDVTKDYFDTQARLENSRRMETQLQGMLKRDNGKVSELLQVERELGRVRGDIEQMQGELKLYDFQVQYATVTLTVREKDLNQAAAYLLQEHDDFSLFATDVEATFQQARHAADEFKAQILSANLNHASVSDVSATLVASVPPEQIEAFLDRVRSLGRVANFTRQTNRVAHDGGDPNQPADQTRTENDRVQVSVSIRSDDDSRKQVAMTVVTPDVDDALEKAKSAALASPGTAIVSSSLAKRAEGPSTAQISVRVTGKNYPALLAAYKALGRTSAFTLQRDDNSGPNSAGDDAPVILSLSLTSDEAPLQQTNMSVRTTDVDARAQQLKKDAADSGVEVKASSFERDPNGMETAQLTLRLPLEKYPAFLDKLKSLGTVETLTVHREDRPDQARTDSSAPAEITLEIHNEGPIVADDNGIWATLRRTFGEGAAALLGSVRTIGVLVAFLAPWLLLLAVTAWIARRIYVARRK